MVYKFRGERPSDSEEEGRKKSNLKDLCILYQDMNFIFKTMRESLKDHQKQGGNMIKCALHGDN